MLAFLNIFTPGHMLLFGIVALLLFGRRLPEVGRSLGKGIMEFKKGLRDVTEELNQKDDDERPKRKLRPPAEDYEDEYDDEDAPEKRPRKRPEASDEE